MKHGRGHVLHRLRESLLTQERGLKLEVLGIDVDTIKSLLTQERGLKRTDAAYNSSKPLCRSLRRSVD